MTFRLKGFATEINARLKEITKIEDIRDYFEYLRTIVKSDQMKLVLDRIKAIIADFVDCMNDCMNEQPLHKDFSAIRLQCFANILEQTLIAAIIECKQMDSAKEKLFGTSAMSYQQQRQRNQLLKFWYKQNCAISQIRLVLHSWNKNTIFNMINL